MPPFIQIFKQHSSVITVRVSQRLRGCAAPLRSFTSARAHLAANKKTVSSPKPFFFFFFGVRRGYLLLPPPSPHPVNSNRSPALTKKISLSGSKRPSSDWSLAGCRFDLEMVCKMRSSSFFAGSSRGGGQSFVRRRINNLHAWPGVFFLFICLGSFFSECG